MVLLNVTIAPSKSTIVNYVAGRRVHPEIKSEDDLLSGNNLGVLELGLPIEFNGNRSKLLFLLVSQWYSQVSTKAETVNPTIQR